MILNQVSPLSMYVFVHPVTQSSPLAIFEDHLRTAFCYAGKSPFHLSMAFLVWSSNKEPDCCNYSKNTSCHDNLAKTLFHPCVTSSYLALTRPSDSHCTVGSCVVNQLGDLCTIAVDSPITRCNVLTSIIKEEYGVLFVHSWVDK